MAKFHYRLSNEIDQDYSTTATHLRILLRFLLSNLFIASIFTTMWHHTDCCTKHHRCEYAIYLLSCLTLEFCIIIDRAVGAPGHVKYFVGSLSARDKLIIELTMEKRFNTELVCGGPNFVFNSGS